MSSPHKVAASVWDADDDEFDRWPVPENHKPRTKTASEDVPSDPTNIPSGSSNNSHAYAEPLILAERYTTLREASIRRAQIGEGLDEGLGLQNLQLDDTATDSIHATITELQDPNYSSPFGEDKNDELMKSFFSKKYRSLPPDAPARHMHIVETKDLIESKDPVIQYLRPRLCDGVATVLHETSPKCLDAFLDSRVKIFEWRRDVAKATKLNMCGIIRRVGNEVLVGTFRNLGFQCRFTYLVRSSICFNGMWTNVYANIGKGMTPRTSAGPMWARFEPSELPPEDLSPTDPLYALYIGRDLARYMFEVDFWDFVDSEGMSLEWEVDGVVTKGCMKRRSSREGSGEGQDSQDEDEE
ncbi:hypothetical protein BCR34DRAFT_237655 [Clohesyomyces aquaticus]|uniref:Uncharacterized protein n=1 Tax=Clohesyomyces aquaticus TaxID=1231657 RepID=A0A1Y1ZVR9_9PLEO|nr:hypothetical protein BCR34DRAFT_237655 [Clohesyomyces aquaticus]